MSSISFVVQQKRDDSFFFNTIPLYDLLWVKSCKRPESAYFTFLNIHPPKKKLSVWIQFYDYQWFYDWLVKCYEVKQFIIIHYPLSLILIKYTWTDKSRYSGLLEIYRKESLINVGTKLCRKVAGSWGLVLLMIILLHQGFLKSVLQPVFSV